MTPPRNIQPFPQQPKFYGEMRMLTPEAQMMKEVLENPSIMRSLNNIAHTVFNDTEAAQVANGLADMEIDVKGEDGKMTKAKVISAQAFNNYVETHFPNVEFNHVNNYIRIVDATGSLTTYSVQQQAYDAAQKKAELQEKSGNDSAPDMGV